MFNKKDKKPKKGKDKKPKKEEKKKKPDKKADKKALKKEKSTVGKEVKNSPAPKSNNNDNAPSATADSSKFEKGDDSAVSFNVGDTRLKLSHGGLSQDTLFKDLVLEFSGPNYKKVQSNTHRFILQVRCPDLLAPPFVSKPVKKKETFVSIVQEDKLPFITPDVLEHILRYCYSGAIDTSKFRLGDVLDLCATAESVKLGEIVWHCEHHVRKIMNGDTIHTILKGAADRKLGNVQKFALEYAFDNWNEFIGNSAGAKTLGLDLFQDFSSKYAKQERDAYPEGPQPKNTIVEDYAQLYAEMPLADMSIMVAGTALKCHRAILGTYSRKMGGSLARLAPGGGFNLTAGQQSQLKSDNAAASFLKFVYFGETVMDPIDAAEMIHKVNGVYNLNTFQLLCEHTIISNITDKSVVAVLGVTYKQGLSEKPHIKELRKQSLAYIIANFGNTDLASLNTMPAVIRTDLLLTLQIAFNADKLGVPIAGSDSTDNNNNTEEKKTEEAKEEVKEEAKEEKVEKKASSDEANNSDSGNDEEVAIAIEESDDE